MREEEEKKAAEIQSVSIPIRCLACGNTTHLVTYGAQQYYECDDVEGCGWMQLA